MMFAGLRSNDPFRVPQLGDTIRTVEPMSEYDLIRPGQHLYAVLKTEDAVEHARGLIARRRWQVEPTANEVT